MHKAKYKKIIERHIFFPPEMICAILDNRKCMTRRIIKPQPDEIQEFVDGRLAIVKNGIFDVLTCPFGKIGDKVFVKERWLPDPSCDDDAWDDHDISYRQWSNNYGHSISEMPESLKILESAFYEAGTECNIRWMSAHSMPQWASRITLEITNIRVERLQEISDDDCDAEFFGGDYPENVIPSHWHSSDDWGALTLQECFKVVWQSTKGKDSWDKNPFVWCLTFKVIK